METETFDLNETELYIGFVGGGAALFGAVFLPTAVCAAEGD